MAKIRFFVLTILSLVFAISSLAETIFPSSSSTSLNSSDIRKNDNITLYSNLSDDTGLSTVTFGWNDSTGAFVNDTLIEIGGANNKSSFENTFDGWAGTICSGQRRTCTNNSGWATDGTYALDMVSAKDSDTCAGSCTVSRANLYNFSRYSNITFDVNITAESDKAGSPAFDLRLCSSNPTGGGGCGGSTARLISNNTAGNFSVAISNFSNYTLLQQQSWLWIIVGDGTDNRSRILIDNVIVYTNATSYNFSVIKQVNSSRGRNVVLTVYFNDTSGNSNTSTTSFTVANTQPVASTVKINNTPISTNDANGSAVFTDVDNDTQSGRGIQWFVNGVYNNTGDNQTLFIAANYTTDDTLIVSFRYLDTEWGNWTNSSTVTVGDAIAPTIPSFFINTTSILTTETLNFTVNATDASSNVQTINFSLITPTGVLDRSFTIPSGRKSVNVSYQLFSGSETATAGTYNISAIRAVDSSNNINTTFITMINFTLTVASSPTSEDGGGQTGGPPPKEPPIIIVKNVTEGCNFNGSCDALPPWSEDVFSCSSDCPFRSVGSSFFFCNDPQKPCFWKNLFNFRGGRAWFLRLLSLGVILALAYLVWEEDLNKTFKKVKNKVKMPKFRST